ncbi:tetratricopeptide repeat protein [Microbacter sp. GSS18]|nr:tetratricopeptide repeat protein [Microbacter sp. GSS18]
MSYILGYDPDTLREKVDPRRCSERLAEIGEQRSLPALLERVWLLKVLDRLDEAIVLSDQSVRVARMAGTRKDLLRARILHASVQQWRGAYAAAVQELTMCAEEAEGQEWSGIAAFAYQHRGKAYFDTEDYDLARSDFKRALFLRQDAGATGEQLESTLLAVDAAERRQAAAAVAS